MKKKLFTVALALIIAITAISGASLAYLKDSDGAKNVMTVGNVKIVQNEQDRNGNDFVQNQKLLPAVYNGTLAYDGTTDKVADKATYKIFDKTVNNELDKFISVTNKGTEDAYIRTIILIENDAENKIQEMLHIRADNSDGQEMVPLMKDGKEVLVTIGGITYSVVTCTYKTALAAGKTSAPSMMQIFLNPAAGNEWYDLVNGQLDILALSQGVQSQGFDNAAQALNAAFGEVNAENVLAWFANYNA